MLPWDAWWREEQARAASRGPAPVKRRSVELDDERIRRVDRIAAVQGIDRHALIALALDHYCAAWRRLPEG